MPGPALDFNSTAEQRLGPYRLLRPISAGGMARVYEGRLDSLAGVSTRVAVKVIHPDYARDPAFQELFISEARISARLEHQNLVRIQQFNREGDLYYLVMEFIEGVTFRKIISQCRRHGLMLPVEVIAELGRQVCEGLHYAHTLANEHGEPLHLVHRDIKPSNLMLNAQGVGKVLDFGISYAHGSGEVAGAVKGTWGYMAMEQAEGLPVGPAADVFGLGAVLYELATLEPLFPDKENGEIRRKLREDVAAQRAAALGGPWQDLGAVLVRALQRDPEARHRGAASFGRALSALVVDPVGVHEQLLRLHRELRQLDGSVAAGAAEKPRSVDTMSRGSGARPGGPGLPIHTGDAHGPARPSRAEPRSLTGANAAKVGVGLGAAALIGVSVLVMAFAGWTLWQGKPRRAETVAQADPVEQRANEMLGEIAAGAEPVAAAEPPAPEASAPAAEAPPAPQAAAPASPDPTTRAEGRADERPVAKADTKAKAASAAVPAAPVEPPPEPVVVVVAEEPPVRIAPTRTAEPAATATAPKKGEGILTISSMPRAQVMIDGQYVRFTPLFQHTVAAGSHTVVLVAEDGRRKTFKVDVPANGQVKRIWLFDEERWSDG
ncbi:MAG: protein kinase domain-containing protein [Myxococcota bacterium]